MIKVLKIIVLFLMILMAIVSGYSLSGVDWENKDMDWNILIELRRPFMCLSLTIFYIIYYIRLLYKEKKSFKRVE